ncbi:hypothetical protein Ciccas_011012 [Cichlidogyrus casuarinus]|uniref:Uncharacterized protein n=1 Tax=Cichlidogyrus casuarinus TaxID=1844966 RepID=A0ABD2PUI1_9PLAT
MERICSLEEAQGSSTANVTAIEISKLTSTKGTNVTGLEGLKLWQTMFEKNSRQQESRGDIGIGKEVIPDGRSVGSSERIQRASQDVDRRHVIHRSLEPGEKVGCER